VVLDRFFGWPPYPRAFKYIFTSAQVVYSGAFRHARPVATCQLGREEQAVNPSDDGWAAGPAPSLKLAIRGGALRFPERRLGPEPQEVSPETDESIAGRDERTPIGG
jgi:hypothetical protein